MASLKEAEYLADTIAHKVSQLMSERNRLRKELAELTSGNIAQDKEYVRMYREGIIEGYAAKMKTASLERMLEVR